MERSVRNIRQILRDNVARFLEHADGREVIITVTAKLVKKHQFENEEQKMLEKDVKVEHPKQNHKCFSSTSSEVTNAYK